MNILEKIKKLPNRIRRRSAPDIVIGEIDLPIISAEDINADGLADIINNGAAIVGETSVLHTRNVTQLYSISGVNDLMNRSTKILCVYERMNDILCKYDLIPYQSDEGQGKLLFVFSEAWRMNPQNFKNVYQDQLSGFRCLYEDNSHCIFNGISTVGLQYEDILEEMKTDEHAYFDIEVYKKYDNKKVVENEENC